MKKTIILLTFSFLFALMVNGQEIPVPPGYLLIESVQGDLDHDGIDELVAAYNMSKVEDENEGTERELRIFKLENGNWALWKKSNSALLNSQDGGMMGDPFGQIQIKKGILLISHNGGSSWKWTYTDKYRFQNDEFTLIGHTSVSGKPCEYWTQFDFNLSTGKIIYKKESDNCQEEEQESHKNENEMFYKKGISISLTNRHDKEIKITSPQSGCELYL